MSDKDFSRRWVSAFVAFATLFVSVTLAAMPPSREGPLWAHHNRAANSETRVEAGRVAGGELPPPALSTRARWAPLPDRSAILQEITSPSDPSRVRVVVDLESAHKGIYFIRDNERTVIPLEFRGHQSDTSAINAEFIARAAYSATSHSDASEVADALIVDYTSGHVEVVRDGKHYWTSPATLPTFTPVITELEEPAPRERVAAR